MDRGDGGWFELECAAPDDAPYAFVVGDLTVPDPASRAQVDDVHKQSRLVRPDAYDWRCEWPGRPWHETVLYETHVGSFAPDGTFDGVRSRLDHLARTGITAIELCPVAQFSGNRGWGYDGVLLYCPHRAYGGPEGLKRLVDAAHERGLMVFLDVVYNHFGPDGNYLWTYAPDFFDRDRHTPWGAGIAYQHEPVRRFVIDNALYWLTEYRIDGLRLDAIDTIEDRMQPPILEAIALAVRRQFGQTRHLTTEDDRNIVSLHRRDEAGAAILYDGEWNDDFHHVAHLLATGEEDGYYADYAADPRGDMVIALTSGYVHQGRPSPYRGGHPRGEPSAILPPTAFVNCLQNHDQTGNRAFGDRLTTLGEPRALEVLTALLLLAPSVPLLFMGEEYGETAPFQFFCDFHGDLARAVRDGRRREFARWKQFHREDAQRQIPDPNEPATFTASRLDWARLDTAEGKARFGLVSTLLAIRAREIVPHLAGLSRAEAEATAPGDRGLTVTWRLAGDARLTILANLGGKPFDAVAAGTPLFRLGDVRLDPWAIHAARGAVP